MQQINVRQDIRSQQLREMIEAVEPLRVIDVRCPILCDLDLSA
jgi:hypothetical protein